MENNRRSFLKKTAIAGIGLGTSPSLLKAAKVASAGTRAADNEGIAIWGHSFPADITPARLAAALRAVDAGCPERPIVNQSIGGSRFDLSMMRQGGYEWTVEVEGGMIPASGRVKLINPRSPNMAKQFNAGLVPIIAKYLPPEGSPAEVLVRFNSDNSSDPVFALAPKQGERLVTSIFSGIRWSRLAANGTYKDTWVSIRGVVGQICVDDPGNGDAPLYFMRREKGDAIRVDGPEEVKMLAVGPDMQHDVATLNRWLKIQWAPCPEKLRWPELYGPSKPGEPDPDASLAIHKLRMQVFVQSALQCMVASEKRLILMTNSQTSAPASDDNNALMGRFGNELAIQFYRDSFPDYFFDFAAAASVGRGSVPPAREWFLKTYPELFRDPEWGWGAELHTIPNGRYVGGNHTGKEKAAVAELRLTGNGGRGVKAAARVGTETHGATRWVKTGLFVSVEARNGVVVRLTVREGGRGYAIGDTITIPANAVGNAAPITGEVTTIREETIGTVRHPEGTVDVAHSYSQWDVDNGYWPRCFRRDSGHFSVPGGEYLSHLLAARIKELGW